MLKRELNKNNFNNKARVTYKTLLNILKRNGCQTISVPLRDMIPFIKYTCTEKYKEKIYISIKRGNAIFSNKPIETKINLKEEKQYQNLVNS